MGGVKMALQVKLLTENAIVPTRATRDSAGLDLFSIMDVCIPPTTVGMVKTGIAIILSEGTYGRIADKSSMALKNLCVCAGVIDFDFRGEIIVLLRNFSPDTHVIKKHQKVAQLIVTQIHYPKVIVVEELSTTERGCSGFGSSGL